MEAVQTLPTVRSVVHLATLVLSVDGRGIAPVGKFLHRPDWPDWTRSMTADGDGAEIRGATVVDADELGARLGLRGALALVVRGREKAPLVCGEETRVWSLDREEWVPVKALSDGESIRVPETSQFGLVVSWAKVVRCQRASLPDRLWMDQHRMWGRLLLRRGAWSYATPSAFVHV